MGLVLDFPQLFSGEASFTEWSVLNAYGKFEHVLRGEPTFEARVLVRNPKSYERRIAPLFCARSE